MRTQLPCEGGGRGHGGGGRDPGVALKGGAAVLLRLGSEECPAALSRLLDRGGILVPPRRQE